MDMFNAPDMAGIAHQLTPKVTAGDANAPATGGTGLPQYSWGFDPATNSWGYFMKKAGSTSDQIGRKAGDKQISYAAPKNDAASMQQQALQHLLDTQVVANAPATTAATTPAATPNVAGSGIGAASISSSGRGGGGNSYDGGTIGNGGIADVYGGMSSGSNPDWGATNQSLDNAKAAVDKIAAKYKLSENLTNKLSNFLGLDTAAQTTAKLDNMNIQQGSAIGYSPEGGIDPATAAQARAGLVDAMGPPASASSYSYSPDSEAMGPPASAANASDSNGAQVGAGPASPMSADPATVAQSRPANWGSDEASYTGPSQNSYASNYSAPDGSDNGNGGHYSESRSGDGGDSGGDSTSSGSAPGGGAATGGLAEASKISHSRFAVGGDVAGLHAVASLPPRMVRGEGDGQSDSIPVKMDDGGDGRLADNEFVVPADAVSALGSGSSEAGARALYAMVDRIRQQAHGTKQQAKPVDPSKVLAA